MRIIKKNILSALVATSLLATGYAQTSNVVVPKLNTEISRPAFLRDKLSDDTVFYARIPSLFSMAFAVKDKNSDVVMQNSANLSVVNNLKSLLENPDIINKMLDKYSTVNLKELPFDIGTLISSVYTTVNGPIEISINDPSGAFSPKGALFITVPVKSKNINELNQNIQKITKQPIELFDNEGFFQPIPNVIAFFDPKESRLYFSASANKIDKKTLSDRVTALKRTPQNKMYAFENQVDLTGQNLFVWGDIEKSRELIKLILFKGESIPTLESYINHTKGIAFGVGTNSKHLGQVKFIAETDTSKLSTIPKQAINIDIKSLGNPSNVAVLSLPSRADIEEIIKLTAPDNIDLLDEIREGTLDKFNTDLTQIIDIFGPELISFNDDNGHNLSLSIRDSMKFTQFLNQLNPKGYITNTKLKNGVNEVKITNPFRKLLMNAINKKDQYSFDSDPEKLGKVVALNNPMVAEFVSAIYGIRALDVNFYFYWIEEGDRILINTLPYSLSDRKQANTSIKDWLNNQGIDTENLIFNATFKTKNAEEKWYRDYIKFMRNNHDLLGLSVDILSMPAPSSFNFKPESTVSFSANVSPEWVSATLNYDISPFYSFSMLSYYTDAGAAPIMAVGVLSMFAIPAYQDYTKRTYVAEGIGLSAGAKSAAIDYFATHDTWPKNNEKAGIADAHLISDNAVDSVEIIPSGRIKISFNGKVASNGYIIYQGEVGDRSFIWRCAETNLPMKFLPMKCRIEIQSK